MVCMEDSTTKYILNNRSSTPLLHLFRTRAIITRDLYILNLLFKGQKRLFKGHMYGWYSRVGYNSAVRDFKF